MAASNARDVEIDIIGQDRTERATRAAQRNFERLRRDVEKLHAALGDSDGTKKLKKNLDDAADKTKKTFGSVVSNIIKSVTGIAVNPRIAPAVAAIGVLFATTIGSAVAAAIVSGMALGAGAGLLAIGVLALKENEKLKAAFTKNAASIKSALAKAAAPLVGPLIDALSRIRRTISGLTPDLRKIFSHLRPVVTLLTKGFSGVLIQVVQALRDSMPGIVGAFKGLAAALPTVGKWIGDFIRTLFKNPKVIENTTEAITKLVFGPLRLLGPLLSGLNVLFGANVNLFRLLKAHGDSLFTALVTWFDGGSGAAGRLAAAWAPLRAAIQNVWDKLVAFAGAKTLDDIEAKHKDLIQAIKDAWGPLKNFLGTVWDEAWAAIKRIWNEKVVPWWNGTAKPWLKEQVAGAMDAIFKMAADKVVAQLKALPGKAIGALAGLPGALVRALGGKMASAGSTIGRAFIDGLVGAVSRGRSRVDGAIGAVGWRAAAAVAGAFSADVGSWAPARTAATFAAGGQFAMAGGGGTSRTGGPTPVQVTSNVYLDGELIDSRISHHIADNNSRQQYRARNRRV